MQQAVDVMQSGHNTQVPEHWQRAAELLTPATTSVHGTDVTNRHKSILVVGTINVLILHTANKPCDLPSSWPLCEHIWCHMHCTGCLGPGVRAATEEIETDSCTRD